MKWSCVYCGGSRALGWQALQRCSPRYVASGARINCHGVGASPPERGLGETGTTSVVLWTLRLEWKRVRLPKSNRRASVDLLGSVRYARPRIHERRARWEFTSSAGQGEASYRVPQRTRPSLGDAWSIVWMRTSLQHSRIPGAPRPSCALRILSPRTPGS